MITKDQINANQQISLILKLLEKKAKDAGLTVADDIENALLSCNILNSEYSNQQEYGA